ncbi:helix-turn-helix transcriptional regulator [Streptomyces lydicus]|uniref:helix-turn-helix transcriptional regulator n=1 Tax=Streptomyces lydicus TaxID=47763 RepID=UPI0028709083|nr:helix-turn-helix transcriptional regulator [Streptomyces lydicus]
MCQREWRRARVQAQRLADLARLRRVRDRIDRHYAQPLNVEALAREVNMSAGHLSRQFRAAYGETLYAYLMTRRIERAAALLRRGDLSVTEVCFAVGCGSLGTYTTRFTELVGMPPGAFRRHAADAADAAAGPAEAGGVARAAGAAMAVEGMPACVAKHVARPVRNREAVVAGQRLA